MEQFSPLQPAFAFNMRGVALSKFIDGTAWPVQAHHCFPQCTMGWLSALHRSGSGFSKLNMAVLEQSRNGD